MIKDIIKNILVDKDHSLIYNEDYYKNFNYYLLLKIFSTNIKLMPFCSYFNKILYKNPLTKYDIHRLFVTVFPKMNANELYFLNIKNNKSDDIIYIKKYFNCGENDAIFYSSIYDNEWIKNIKETYQYEGR